MEQSWIIQLMRRIAKVLWHVPRSLRLQPFYLCSFYHPSHFTLDAQRLSGKVCSLAIYLQTYRDHAHQLAQLDPLSIYNQPRQYLIRPTDLGINYQQDLNSYKSAKGPLFERASSVEQLENLLKRLYQTSVGIQFSHLVSEEEKDWLYENYQRLMLQELSEAEKIHIARILVQSQGVDHFLHKKFSTFKRYSGEGAESTSLSLDQLFRNASKEGVEHIVLGMPHRGRFNVLTNLMQYEPRLLFRKISGKMDTPQELFHVVDDVASHIAHSTKKQMEGKKVKVTMIHNPSHLQAQNPVSMGKTRSKQALHGNDKVLNIQVHGDAAFCAQGVVYESMCLGKVPKFNIDGTVHIITNNQLGFTTKPKDGRNSKYCTEIGKAFGMPIIHINSEHPQQVARIMKLCVKYRQKFRKDILVDLVCYRKYGHNEVDEPEFTQPKMYHHIRKVHIPSPSKYTSLLAETGIVLPDFYDLTRKTLFEKLEKEFDAAQNVQSISLQLYLDPNRTGGPRAFTQQWKHMRPSQLGEQFPTGFDVAMLKEFAQASVYTPQEFAIHPRIKKYFVSQRLKSISKNSLDWATCQALALFSLNYQGYNIRFTGQDVERGTFSQRYSNFVDNKTEQIFSPLQFFAAQNPGRGKVEVYNSPLSENAVLSYEYGYSLDEPTNMTIWEAQFGDFFNTAQVAIDTFLTNSENKWMRQTGLVLNLPHGFDGAGPEHSSCRIERFLQLANTDGGLVYKKNNSAYPLQKSSMKKDIFQETIQSANFSLIVPTTPANMYHALRRQMKRNFRKPLIIAGPKTLLRLPSCRSKFQELGPGSVFQRIIPYVNQENIRKCSVVLICSGKIVYSILEQIKQLKCPGTCLVTIEELFPFPEIELLQFLRPVSKQVKVFWVQEQNLNGGAYSFVQNRLARILRVLQIKRQHYYIGRRAIATTAVGNAEQHKNQSNQLAQWINSVIQ